VIFWRGVPDGERKRRLIRPRLTRLGLDMSQLPTWSVDGEKPYLVKLRLILGASLVEGSLTRRVFHVCLEAFHSSLEYRSLLHREGTSRFSSPRKIGSRKVEMSEDLLYPLRMRNFHFLLA